MLCPLCCFLGRRKDRFSREKRDREGEVGKRVACL